MAYVIYSDELYHHGVKGMHWGIRRIKDKLNARKEKKIRRNQMLNDNTDFDDEYDRTEKGKAQLSEYRKQINKMMSDKNWDANKKSQKSFYKSEETYLRSQQEYSAKKLIEKYGEEETLRYATNDRITSGKTAVQAMSDNWWVHAM